MRRRAMWSRLALGSAVGVALVVAAPFPVAAAVSAPTTPTVSTPAAETVDVAWTHPTADASVAGYRVYTHIGGVTSAAIPAVDVGADQRRATVTGLTVDIAYQFVVQAITTTGLVTSLQSSAVTPYDVPDKPSNIRVEAGDTAVQVSWDLPDANGSPLTKFELTTTPSTGDTVEVSGTTTTVTLGASTGNSFVNGNSYTVTLKAFNVRGSTTSDPSGSVTPLSTVVGAPTINETTPGSTTIEVVWSPSTVTGGSSWRSHTVTATPTSGSPVSSTVLHPGQSATLTGLDPSTSYSVTAVGFTLSGVTSSASTAVSVTTLALPTAETPTVVPPAPAPATPGAALPGVPESLAGEDRIATAIAVAEADFEEVASLGSLRLEALVRAQSAVLVAAGAFADAITAGPLAVNKVGPLFLTSGNSLDTRVVDALRRLVPAGSTVYLVGGTAVLAPAIEQQLSDLGFAPSRLAGSDRYATAVEVARSGLGNPSHIFAATGLDFPDALAAGVIAGRLDAAVVLTRGEEIPESLSSYLDELAGETVEAVGGPAARAFPDVRAHQGADRNATAVALATAYPPDGGVTEIGVANGRVFPDALVASPYLARRNTVLVLAVTGDVPSATASYLQGRPAGNTAQVFGGLSVMSDLARRVLSTLMTS